LKKSENLYNIKASPNPNKWFKCPEFHNGTS